MKKIILILAFVAVTAATASAQYSAVRINALGIATGTLNLGADVAVGSRWSVEGTVYWNPIKTGAFSSRFTAFSAGVRYWRFEPHVGAFVGIHSTTAFYDVGGRKDNYKGWMSGVGVSYGYSWMLATRWNLTAELGLGCFYMKDKKRRNEIIDDEDIYIRHYRRIVVAPSRAEISVSYLF